MRQIGWILLMSFVGFLASLQASANEIEKVGGNYRVSKIAQTDGRDFHVQFEAIHKTGRFDRLNLFCDHLHIAVQEGDKIRLSAQIRSEKGDSAEVSQVVLFLNSKEGRLPIWMLSNRGKPGPLRGAKYLEMHAPSHDFLVL